MTLKTGVFSIITQRIVKIAEQLSSIHPSPPKLDNGTSRPKRKTSNLTRNAIIRDTSRSGGDNIQYYTENGLRKVVPYNYTFTAFCKRRWIGRKLLEILDSEFNFDKMDVIINRILSGKIRINGENVGLEYVFKDSDLMEHNLHRHELAVLNDSIDTVYEDDSIIVVNKPASMPVHPCGQFHHNTLVKILHNERGLSNLRVIHRLDRMTSGLVIIGKTFEAASTISSEINSREVSKFYVAEVEGKFKGADEKDEEEEAKPVIVDQPLGRLDCKMGLSIIMPESEGGKQSKTTFIRMAWRKPVDEKDPGSSIVLCRLYTGRTHQVRIHLQYLGFPIVDDPLYNSFEWGPTKGSFAVYHTPRDELIAKLGASRSRSAYLDTILSEENVSTNPVNITKTINKVECKDTDFPINKKARMTTPDKSTSPLRYYSSTEKESITQTLLEAAYDAKCEDCNRRFKEPLMQNLVLRLHAWRYSGSNWTYTAPLPQWVLEQASISGLDNVLSCIEKLLPRL